MRCALMLLFVSALGAGASADLYAAVKADSAEAIGVALEAGAAIDAQAGPGKQTALMFAVLNGKETAVRELLARGASTTIPEKDGYTPMHGAGFQGRAAIAAILAARGVPVDEPHRDGFRPIQRACWGRFTKHADTVRELLRLGATLGHATECKTKTPATVHVLQDFRVPGSDRTEDYLDL